MWIIPQNHPLYSAYAPEYVDSKEDLKTHIGHLVGIRLHPSLIWRSKPLPLKTWLAKWNRVYWLPLLFGRTLKPSHMADFEERWILSLEDTHVNHFPLPVLEKESKTQDISGLISPKELTLFDLEPVSSKTSEITLTSDMRLSGATYKKWVTLLGKEYTVRKRLAQSIAESDCSSLPLGETPACTTPVATDMNRTTKYKQGGTALSLQVKWRTPSGSEHEGGVMKILPDTNPRLKLRDQVSNKKVNWQTPTTDNSITSPEDMRKRATQKGYRNGTTIKNLASQIDNWPTASARDYKDTPGMSTERDGKELGRVDQLPRAVYREKEKIEQGLLLGKDVFAYPAPDNLNRHGNVRGLLNPAWVCQLMGIALEKTFFVHLETPCTPTQPK